MGDYDYYEEPQPVPTFSDGSTSGGRGANSRAAASRASASRVAISAASRASAIMAASIQQLPKNSIITSNGIRNIAPAVPAVNMAAIRAAQKRSEIILKTAKAPEPIVIKAPVEVVAHIPETTTILEPISPQTITKVVAKSQVYSSDIYKAAVNLARSKKEELLISLELPTFNKKSLYDPVKYIRHNTVPNNVSINQPALQQLASNLSTLLRNNDKTLILDEFNRYQTNLRISTEQPLHKIALQQARLNKTVYLTSDA